MSWFGRNVSITCVLACAIAGASCKDAARTNDEALGALRFEVACNAEAKARFRRGLLALHSFWYEEAERELAAAIRADATCAMAYWGLAMSKAKLLWGEDDLKGGRDALMKMPAPNELPVREQAWVMAALSLFRKAGGDVLASRRDFLATMEALHAKFPDDESAAFLALALISTIRPGVPDEVAIRRRAGELAAGVLAHNPHHPGAAHYLIHAYDTPELAQQALATAKSYAKTIAPAAFHARHMPSHIFARLGMWKEAAASCRDAWDVSVAWAKRERLPQDSYDFHSLAWLVEISFERGRRGDADRALATFRDAVKNGLGHDKRAQYAQLVASYAARTGEWKRVDEYLAVLDEAKPTTARKDGMCGQPPAAGPAVLFERRAATLARAHAAAMQRDRGKLDTLLAEWDRIEGELRPFLEAQDKALLESADRVRPNLRAVLLARAANDDRALVTAVEPLALSQQDEFIGEGVAGGLLYEEELADAFVRMGEIASARERYQHILTRHPGRARALLHAARAAKLVGDDSAARDHYARLLDAWREADGVNAPVLEEARSHAKR